MQCLMTIVDHPLNELPQRTVALSRVPVLGE